MHDRIDGKEEFAPHDLGREGSLPGKCTGIAGDVIGRLRVAVLNRNLHMVQPGLGQCAEGLVGNPYRRGDQIGVKAGCMSAGSDVHEIAPGAGLAPR
jgi:hypothetical protein